MPGEPARPSLSLPTALSLPTPPPTPLSAPSVNVQPGHEPGEVAAQGAAQGTQPTAALDWPRLTAIMRAHESKNVSAGGDVGPPPSEHADVADQQADQQAGQQLEQQAEQQPEQQAYPTRVRSDTGDTRLVAAAPAPVQSLDEALPVSTEDLAPDATSPPGQEEVMSNLPPRFGMEDVAAVLRQVQPAHNAESAVHIVTPRGPRPVHTPAVQRRAGERSPSTVVPPPDRTEAATGGELMDLSDLPVNLWALIGEAPPAQLTASDIPLWSENEAGDLPPIAAGMHGGRSPEGAAEGHTPAPREAVSTQQASVQLSAQAPAQASAQAAVPPQDRSGGTPPIQARQVDVATAVAQAAGLSLAQPLRVHSGALQAKATAPMPAMTANPSIPAAAGAVPTGAPAAAAALRTAAAPEVEATPAAASGNAGSDQLAGSLQAPEQPDVHALAQQVYSLLRRRLIIERERRG